MNELGLFATSPVGNHQQAEYGEDAAPDAGGKADECGLLSMSNAAPLVTIAVQSRGFIYLCLPN